MRIPGSDHTHLSSIELGGLGAVTDRLIDTQLGRRHAAKLKTLKECTNGPTAIKDHLLFQTMTSKTKMARKIPNLLMAKRPKSMMTPTLSTT
jgi:hypothetical protein